MDALYAFEMKNLGFGSRKKQFILVLRNQSIRKSGFQYFRGVDLDANSGLAGVNTKTSLV